MTLSGVSLIFECLVAALLAVMIYYAIRLNQRITQMRERENEMQGLIDSFNEAAVRAESSAASLKAVGAEAERSLRGCIDRAQALRDDLMFLIDRGDAAASDLEKTRAGRKTAVPHEPWTVSSRAPAVPAPEETSQAEEVDVLGNDDGPDDGASRAERELARALFSNRRSG